MCEICSKLTIKTPERRHCPRSDVLIVNFEQISHFVLCFHCYFEQVNVYWEKAVNKTNSANKKNIVTIAKVPLFG